ncbi:hypothetical protein J2S40_003935 [Nocardioides luteus]|uniref:DUF3618 domain-containing protein n=1 Tax=Nocardioides luteus TaxID=1844 RepID=A0ABQ5SZ80_9ACTN|nr:hypothetical protein [Nocardioides luteus]MDR7312877.1 hypothetical protein [Nocardioides luteus]GGR48197.1 hypothetical protein GCM10010197_12670 [Nocardioides luteus]GLJ69131.1 hypothetical protein GCM10017579_31670 [Nocardioides luteus]
MESTTMTARHRSDLTAVESIRNNVLDAVRSLRKSDSSERKHRSGMPPAADTTLFGVAIVAATGIIALGLVN